MSWFGGFLLIENLSTCDFFWVGLLMCLRQYNQMVSTGWVGWNETQHPCAPGQRKQTVK